MGGQGGTIDTGVGQADDPGSQPGAVFGSAGGEFEGKIDFFTIVAHKGGAHAGDADGVIGLDGDDLVFADEGVKGIENGLGDFDAAALGTDGVGLRSRRQGDGGGSRNGSGGGFGYAFAGAKRRKKKIDADEGGDNDHDQPSLE